MFSRRQWTFDWSEFITGVLFLIAALAIFRNPKASLTSFVVIFGMIAIVRGITKASAYRHLKKDTGFRANFMLFNGIFDILLGLFFIMNLTAGILTLSYLFAFWFIVDSVIGLANVSHFKQFNSIFYMLIIIFEILGLLLGISLLFRPMLAAFSLTTLVAWYFIIWGINSITVAFTRQM